MKPLSIALALGAAATPVMASSASAQSGCVGRVLLPPTATSHGERVLEAPASVVRRYLPAQIERGGYRVLVVPPRLQRVSWRAEYRVERRTVSVPGPVRWTRSADRYGEVAEHILVAPGHYVWERRFGPLVSAPPQPGQTVVSPTGLVMCRVWCPARYEVVLRRVRVAGGRPEAVPTTVQREISRRVLIRAAGSSVRRTPARYRWVSTSRVAAPGRWEVQRTPARYGWRKVISMQDGGTAYAPVVCGGPLSRPALARMQASLAAQGYDPGREDGVSRPQTYAALRRFQVDHRLAAGQVTVESARALGVIP